MGAIGENEIHKLRNKWLEFSDKRSIALTSEEQKWLVQHQDLRLGVDPAWPPFEFIDKNGNYAGISSGFIEAISDRLKIKMTPTQGLTWSQVIEKAKAGEIDVLPAVIQTSDRDKYLNFTKPYLSFPIVTAINKNTPFIGSIKDLEGYRVGVVKDYYTEDILRNDHPYLKLVAYATVAEALQELDAGHIDAFIDNLVTINQDITERKHMEEEMKRNVEELERFSKLAFGREKKMIRLKQEINELRGQLDQDEKYKIVK